MSKWAQFEDASEAKGYALIPNAVLRYPGLSLAAKSLYALLKSFAWQDSSTYPGVKTLCAAAGVSKDTLGKYLKELVAAELIEIKRRGRGQTNLYVFKSILNSRILDGDTGSHQESDTGSALDGDTGSHNEDSVDEDSEEQSVEANASSGKPQKSDVVSMEYHLTKTIYESMKEAGSRLPKEQFKFHLGRAQDMLAKDNPTDEELEALPEAFKRHWTIKGWADAPAALNEMRRQKARDELLNESKDTPAWEPINPHGEQGTKAKDKPYKPFWYATFYSCTEDEAEKLIAAGLKHGEICERLGSDAA